jgi:hypothetical protein
VLGSIARICWIKARRQWRRSTVTCVLLVACTCSRLAYGQIGVRPVETDLSPSSQENSRSADSPQVATSTNDSSQLAPKRILGIIPNYRTAPSLRDYEPLSPRQKFKLASQDSFDRGAIILGALFGGEAQLTKSTPSFGHGGSGYARYFAAPMPTLLLETI